RFAAVAPDVSLRSPASSVLNVRWAAAWDGARQGAAAWCKADAGPHRIFSCGWRSTHPAAYDRTVPSSRLSVIDTLLTLAPSSFGTTVWLGPMVVTVNTAAMMPDVLSTIWLPLMRPVKVPSTLRVVSVQLPVITPSRYFMLPVSVIL